MLRPPPLGSSSYGDTQVRVGRGTPDNNFIRKSVYRSRQTRRRCQNGLLSERDCWRAYSLDRRRDSRKRGATPLLTCPRRSAALLSVGGTKNQVPSGKIPRPPTSLHTVTAIREYGSANALWTATLYEKAFATCAKIVVDVSMGYFRPRDCWRICSPARRRGPRPYGTTPLLPRPRRSAAALRVGCTEEEDPSVRILRPPARFILSQRYATVARKCTPDNNFIRKSVFCSRRTRRRCCYSLLAEGMPSNAEERFAKIRHHASPWLSSPVCCPTVGS